MRMRTLFLAAVAGAMFPCSAGAQSSEQPTIESPDVIVRGVRSKASKWREAETSHLVVLSDGSESELVRLTRNLERLHFLLSGLLGRVDRPDDTVKIRITLIGDVAEFNDMDLQNKRWQQGPFNDLFRISRYYDPREDGAVMATTRVDQRTVIEPGQDATDLIRSLSSGTNLGARTDPMQLQGLNSAAIGDFATAGLVGSGNFGVRAGEHAIEVPAESLLYAGYAQHYLLTYFPAAYPRWYLDGFGQVFGSFATKGDNILEFGRAPSGTAAVLDRFGSFPLQDILNDKYLTEKPSKTNWTPIHAWLLTHFLMFSDTRRPQLNRYLTARVAGADPATAAAVFGDQKQLAKDLRAYFWARKPYEKGTYPANRTEEPIVRRLSQCEAALILGRLELGARLLRAPLPAAGMVPQQSKLLT